MHLSRHCWLKVCISIHIIGCVLLGGVWTLGVRDMGQATVLAEIGFDCLYIQLILESWNVKVIFNCCISLHPWCHCHPTSGIFCIISRMSVPLQIRRMSVTCNVNNVSGLAEKGVLFQLRHAIPLLNMFLFWRTGAMIFSLSDLWRTRISLCAWLTCKSSDLKWHTKASGSIHDTLKYQI